MFTTLRKHQRWLMLVIASLTILAFAFLYNTTNLSQVGSNIVAKIYGRNVMQVDVEKAVRNYQLSLALGQLDLVRSLAGQAQNENEAAGNFIWNLMILQHEAVALEVEPGTQSVVDRIKTLPVFQNEGRFDTAKYAEFVQKQLAPRGFTERQLEEVIRDSLRLEGVKALVESPAMLQPAEIEPVLARLAPADVVLLEFGPATLAKEVAVSDEEVQKAYDEKKGSLQAPEKRAVRYAAFLLTPEQLKLKDKARIDALQKVATATSDFSQALGDSGQSMAVFGQEKNHEIHITPVFGPDGAPIGKLWDYDQEVITAAKEVAFRLPSQPGNYEIVELSGKGYAVIEVAEVQPARPLTFEEARADLRAQLIESKRDTAVADKAAAAIPAIREKLSKGVPIAQASTEAGLKTSQINGLSVFDTELKPEQRQMAGAAMDQAVGTLGDFTARPGGGGFATYVAKRGEPDAKTLAERRPMIEKGALQGKQMLLFAQWLVTAREQSGLQILRPAM